jgi:hypothetical protein
MASMPLEAPVMDENWRLRFKNRVRQWQVAMIRKSQRIK